MPPSLSDFKFGIEFEARPGSSGLDAFGNLAHTAGLSHVVYCQGSGNQIRAQGLRDGQYWWYGCDGDGIEVKTPIMIRRDWAEIAAMLSVMKRHGCRYGPGSGMHVHLDMQQFDIASKLRILSGWWALEPLFFRLVEPRRAVSGWAPHVRNSITRDMLAHAIIYGAATVGSSSITPQTILSSTTRRAFGPNGGWPTFENRVHHSCLDIEDVFSWVTTLQAMTLDWESQTNATISQMIQSLSMEWDRDLRKGLNWLKDRVARRLTNSTQVTLVTDNLEKRFKLYTPA